ncbi:uncharacterized protein LOC101234411 isoform X4 [Hydra vulgaris]|uniref:Uncharacterized protein LOC101234411 isoform X4 n=1 Tax=Hydra vulgaris TaxID=6087 RepID=A0ABM4BE52_HYDVU
MSATSFEKDIACLDERIKKLHCLVFSNCSTSSCKIFEVVEQAKCTLKEVETRHLVVTLLWKKLPQLQEFLDTEFIKKIKLTDEVKTSLILANEENIRNLSKNLEELKKLQNVVNHPSLKGGVERFLRKIRATASQLQYNYKYSVEAIYSLEQYGYTVRICS